MPDKPSSGEILGVPYNFERPNLSRMLSSYWKPGDGMLVKKPFGVGYTLNMANWRSWVVIGVAGLMLWRERASEQGAGTGDDEAVEVVVED